MLVLVSLHSTHASLGLPDSIPKRYRVAISSVVLAQLTAEGCYTLQWAEPFSLNIAPSPGESGPHLMRGSLDPPESTTQTASRSVEPFLQGS